MSNHYTDPSGLMRTFYRLIYDPLRAGYLRRLVESLQLDGSERVLDFGSGPGSEAYYLARALDRGGRVTCLDVSAAWLARARGRLRRFDNVEFVLGEAPEVGLPPETFDLALAHYVLHDVDPANLPAAIGAIARALRPGGRFAVVEPVGSHHGLKAPELRTLMAAHGLTEVDVTPLRPPLGSAYRAVFRRS